MIAQQLIELDQKSADADLAKYRLMVHQDRNGSSIDLEALNHVRQKLGLSPADVAGDIEALQRSHFIARRIEALESGSETAIAQHAEAEAAAITRMAAVARDVILACPSAAHAHGALRKIIPACNWLDEKQSFISEVDAALNAANNAQNPRQQATVIHELSMELKELKATHSRVF